MLLCFSVMITKLLYAETSQTSKTELYVERLERFLSTFWSLIQVKSQQEDTGITYRMCSKLKIKTLKTLTRFGF